MITPPERLLFATDFSGRCDRPLERSVRLARLWGAKLLLLHVLEPHRRELTDFERTEEEARITAKLRAEVQDPAVDLETRLAAGPVHATIAEVSEETDAELIVTGVSRYDELGDFVLGTTVDRLVRRAHVPVLVVKERAKADYAGLLAPTDFSNASALAVETAAGFFPDAALSLAHAYTVRLAAIRGREAHAPELQAEIAQELADFLDHLHLSEAACEAIDFHLDYGETGPVVAGIARTIGADLAVIGAHGKSGFVAATIGSTAKDLLETLPCDILLVPDDAP